MAAVVDRLERFLGGGNASSGGTLALVHVNVLVYSMCFWVQQPALPYLSQALGASATELGSLDSLVSALSLGGGLVMGRMTDVMGAKATIIASQLASLTMYSLMAIATSLPILVASRLPAFLQHAMLCAQAATSAVVESENRTVALGRLSLSYAIGMVFGSPLGGQIAKAYGYHAAATVAAGITLVVILLDVVFMPGFKTKTDEKREESGSSALDQAKAIAKVVAEPKVLRLLLFTLPISIGIGGFRSIFAVAAKDLYNFDSADLGYYISFSAFVGLLANVFLIGIANRKLGDYKTLLAASALQMMCFGAMPYTSSLTEFAILTIPNTIGSTLLYTLSGALMSFAVDKENTGSAIAVSHGSRSLVGIISPILAGRAFDSRGVSGLCQFISGACFVSVLVALTASKDTLLTLEAAKRNSAKKDEESKKVK